MTENMTELENKVTELEGKEREFVVPGDEIIKSMEYLPGRNCFRDGDSIYSKRLGIIHIENRVISVIPLVGSYVAEMGDMVIGEVEEIQSSGWIININTANSAYLPLSGVRGFIRSGTDLSRIYNFGDLLYTKILSGGKQSLAITMQDIRCRKLLGGKIMEIDPTKVPRLIGKKGSMISMIKEKTGCSIFVGQNGVVWLKGENEDVVTETIKRIERESFKEGLTDEIEKSLSKVVRTQPAPFEQKESDLEDKLEAAENDSNYKENDYEEK